MALSSCDFSTTFQFGASPKTFIFEDITDYAEQGVGLSEVTGVIKVTDPLGNVHYNNTDFNDPDIDPDVILTSVKTITLPLDANGVVLQGSYTLLYSVRGSSLTINPAVDVTKEYTFVLDYASPTVSLTLTANCVKPLMQSNDDTSYLSGSTTPTITRVHTIVYPESLGITSITGTAKLLETNVFYTKKGTVLVHSSKVVATLSYNFFTNMYVTDSVEGSKFVDVACEGELCDIYCCVKAEWDRYMTYKGTNTIKAKEHLENFHLMTGLMKLIQVALECGKDANIATFVKEIQDLGNCESGCGCDDGTPILVTGLGGGVNTFVVETGGTPVEVTSVVAGSTTTYTVKLAASFVTKVNDSYNTIVAAGSGATVTVVTDGSGNKTYTVTLNSTVTEPDILSLRVKLTFSAGSLPIIALTGISKYGSAFSNTPAVSNDQSIIADWKAKNNSFTFKEFWSNQGSKVYKASIHIINTDDKFTSLNIDTMRTLIDAKIFNDQGTTFKITLTDSTGVPLSGIPLDGFLNNLTLAIILTA